jgi:hypothetical protein
MDTYTRDSVHVLDRLWEAGVDVLAVSDDPVLIAGMTRDTELPICLEIRTRSYLGQRRDKLFPTDTDRFYS